MELDYILNNRLIDRYLAGKLSTTERDQFEEQLLWSRDLLAEVEIAEKLREGIRDLAESGELRRQKNVVQRSRVESFFASPGYALAASVMLVLSLSATGVLLIDDGFGPAMPQVGMPAQIYTLHAVRGASTVNVLPAVSGQELAVLALDPGPQDYDSYRVSLYREAQGTETAPLWQLEHAEPGERDLLAFAVPGSLLTPGNYTVTVEGWRQGRPVSESHEFVTEIHFRAAGNE